MSGVSKPVIEKSPTVIVVEKEVDDKGSGVVSGDHVARDVLVESRKGLSEPLVVDVDKKDTPGLPPIDINELANVLRNPDMPSHKIMKEVADKIVSNCEKSADAKTPADVPGMKNLFDCIMEVSLLQQDSDNSDDDEPEEDHEPIIRHIPCRFCSKVFGSTMTMKTHVLVAHPREDPVVLNVQQLTKNELEATGDKSGPSSRKRSKSSGRSDLDGREKKSRHPSKTDEAKAASVGAENIPVGTRRASLSRSQSKVSPNAVSRQSTEQQDVAKPRSEIPETPAVLSDPDTATEATTAAAAPSVRSSSRTSEASQSAGSGQKRASKREIEEDRNLNTDSSGGSEETVREPSASKRQRLSQGSTAAASTEAPTGSAISSRSRRSLNAEKRAESGDKSTSETPSPAPQGRPRRSSRRL
ncbi:uncharacterized protein LOC101851144 [Aplysia californica]|uniref:Uncharacterized protein LOC101851144 n=1 Tax=Aplysia californica TaxID=6500 RepID=A0ABM0K1F6_APLCA|nr:uncharacterized protein LOC101851144 [Aplysia californica]